MKRLIAFILAMVLVLSLSATAFAAENTGSITITNATVDETYTPYKIFDASIKLAAGGATAEAVSYTIEKDNQFFKVLFGDDGTAINKFFSYNASTGSVTKKEGVNDSELIKYLTELVAGGTYTSAADAVLATGKVVKFEDLPYGYYLITSSLGSTVTINSNTPNVEVIDKNQKPVPDFDKQVQTGVENGKPVWGDSNTANIGDKFSYRISFTATNYDGDKKIKYYQIHDEKGDALWAEFDSFTVKVGGVKLERGYYLSQGGVNTNNWEYLGDWSGADKTRENAQWYLVHLGYDQFRITIPWLENHTLTDNTNENGDVVSYTLGFAEDAASKYASPVQVEITYDVVLEANAAIGETSHGNRFNKAYASWTSEYETGSNTPDEVVTYTYGLGLLKDDTATGQNLAGAEFRIYSDAKCTEPVYVIPTNVKGVYILDSYGMPIEKVTGTGRQPSREVFAAYLEDYLKDEEGKTITQNNLVVSQVNGKLAVLGLAADTYYLKEVKAPAGYNALSQPVALEAGKEIRPFVIYADAKGNVADIQAEDGTYQEHTLSVTHTVVHNSKGVELPSTGGEGTMMLITIGTMIAMAFAVLLITHKKMSIYQD